MRIFNGNHLDAVCRLWSRAINSRAIGLGRGVRAVLGPVVRRREVFVAVCETDSANDVLLDRRRGKSLDTVDQL